MKKLTKITIKHIFKPRENNSHKGNHGHSLLIAGNTGKMGAAVISARACLRAGTGLLSVNIPKEERFILQTTIPEAMLQMRDDKNEFTHFSAIGIGPGIGLTNDSLELLNHVLASVTKPIVFDADALNLIAANKNLLAKIPKNSILTPHPTEFDRLFGIHKNHNDRINTAVNKSKEYKIVIVLKDHKTIITYGDEIYFNNTGNAGLAKGGSGDALTGIITAFLANGYKPFEAAQLGVYIHGLAADLTLKKQSMESMLITDVIENLGKAFMKIIEA